MQYGVPLEKSNRRRSQVGLLIVIALATVAIFLFVQHWPHMFGILPYLLLLACPIVHLFMPRGHGGHSGHA